MLLFNLPFIPDYADDRLGPDDLKPRLRIDGCLGFRNITGDFAAQMALLAPFGTGNPRPLFEANGVTVVDGPRRTLTGSAEQVLADLQRFADHGYSHVTMHLDVHSGTIEELFEIVQRFAEEVLPATREIEARPLQ